jgi:PmbA protein
VEALIAEVSGRLEPPLLGEASLPETLRVWLAPRATTKLFRPLLRGLTAGTLLERAAPLRFRLGEHVAPEAISLTDDPLRPLRPGSRPVDDEGVVSRIVPLVERGRLVGWIADLVTGARLGIPSTGHGRRWPFAPPRPAFSNLCLVPGEASPEDLSSAARDGVLIRDLPIVTADAGGGRIAAETPWAYRLAGEEVVGRLPRLRLRGNLHRMLDRLVALGREAEWLGSWCSPGLVLDAVEVSLC